MKKIKLILVASWCCLLISCFGGSSNKKNETKVVSNLEKIYITKELKIEMNALVANLVRLGEFKFIERVLTPKEKKVEPTFLLDLEKAKTLATRNEKLSAVMMYYVDMQVAKLYDLPLENHKNVITKLEQEINSPMVVDELTETTSVTRNDLYSLYDSSLKTKELDKFWLQLTAGLIENMYVISHDPDRYLVGMTDDYASRLGRILKITAKATLLVQDLHPQLKSLNQVMTPIYKINAVKTSELREQILTNKAEIEKVRAYMLGQ